MAEIVTKPKKKHGFLKFIVFIAFIYVVGMIIMTVNSDPTCLKNAGGNQGAAVFCSTTGVLANAK